MPVQAELVMIYMAVKRVFIIYRWKSGPTDNETGWAGEIRGESKGHVSQTEHFDIELLLGVVYQHKMVASHKASYYQVYQV